MPWQPVNHCKSDVIEVIRGARCAPVWQRESLLISAVFLHQILRMTAVFNVLASKKMFQRFCSFWWYQKGRLWKENWAENVTWSKHCQLYTEHADATSINHLLWRHLPGSAYCTSFWQLDGLPLVNKAASGGPSCHAEKLSYFLVFFFRAGLKPALHKGTTVLLDQV